MNLILDFSLYRQRTRRLIQRIGRAERIRDDGSSAIILSIKVLADDLQLTPRDVIMGEHQDHSYLGLSADEVVSERLIELVLPPPLSIQYELQGLHISKEIMPQGAKIMFPKDNKRHKIGVLPVDTEHTYSGQFFPHFSSAQQSDVDNSSAALIINEDQDEWIDLLRLFG